MMEPITKEEQNAINTLNRLAKRWPESLWLFSVAGQLLVMRKGPDGEHVQSETGSVCPDHEVAHIAGIDNDGGDW